MRVKTSLDWQTVSLPLVSQMHSAPPRTRKDLAKMIGHVTGLVQQLGNEEVLMRQTTRSYTPKQQELLVEIEESIVEFEKWLLIAHLSYG